MPPNDHLTWTEVTEFGTLWTRDTQLMPANAAQQMDNCYPQPGGGLRAFMAQASTLAITGLNSGTTDTILGFRSWANSGVTAAEPNYHIIAKSLAASIKHYRWENPWSLKNTFANTASNGVARFSEYLRNGYLVMGVPSNGTWYTPGNAATQVGVESFLTTHQTRIIAQPTAFQVRWSDPGGLTIPAANNIDVSTPANAEVALAAGIEPSDLFIVTRGGHTLLVQGDLSDPTIREMSQLPRMPSTAMWAKLPSGGIATVAEGGGIWQFGGGEPQKLSESLDDAFTDNPSNFSLTTAGNIEVSYPFLIAPLGYIMDLRTRAWFRCTAFSTVRLFSVDPVVDPRFSRRGLVTGVPEGLVSAAWPQIPMREETGVTRVTTFTWKSAPLRDPSGRQFEIREVQLSVKSYEADAQLVVTVNGTARTVTLPTAGRHNPRFLFRERSQQLDVTVTSTGGAGSTEAPTIESVRIGSLPRHLLRYPT